MCHRPAPLGPAPLKLYVQSVLAVERCNQEVYHGVPDCGNHSPIYLWRVDSFLWRRKTKLSDQGVNDITVKNVDSLPLINSAFESLENVQIFIELDLHNYYHLVWIQEGDERKTVFNYPFGHFEYLFMPFGLTNATTTKISYLLRLRNVSFILTVYFLGFCYWGICYWCSMLDHMPLSEVFVGCPLHHWNNPRVHCANCR